MKHPLWFKDTVYESVLPHISGGKLVFDIGAAVGQMTRCSYLLKGVRRLSRAARVGDEGQHRLPRRSRSEERLRFRQDG
jgi:hypothetical protein